ncbi:FHA domain-containing protein [Labrys portucalensis]|uniref:FHA domain-containing protein n=1 Tax=Labrys neptuniae TaxID=376174 RepID=A0ABV6ZL31_9HYPH
MPTGMIDKAQGEAHALRRPSPPPAADKTRFEPESAVNFQVTDGLHKDASLGLDEVEHTIGSGRDADIVLRDAGIAPLHARLRYRGGRVEIEALGGALSLAKGEILPEGHGRRCRLPLEVGIGEARFRLEARRGSSRAARLGGGTWLGRLLFASGAVIVTVVGASLALNWLPSATAFSSQPHRTEAPQTLADITEKPAAQPVVASSTDAAAPASRARDDLAGRLAAAGFSNLTIATEKDRLVVSGVLPAQQGEAWRDVQARYDQAYGDRVPLVSRVETGKPAQSPPLTLRAIWFGERPYVIASDGARYHEGAFVTGGWTIEKIGEDDLRLAKNGSTLTLKYR